MTVTSTHVSYLLISSLVVSEYKVYSVFYPTMPLLDYFVPTSKGMHQCERHRKNTSASSWSVNSIFGKMNNLKFYIKNKHL